MVGSISYPGRGSLMSALTGFHVSSSYLGRVGSIICISQMMRLKLREVM